MEMEQLERVVQQPEMHFVQVVIPGIIYQAVHVCRIFVFVKMELLQPTRTVVTQTDFPCAAVVILDFIYQPMAQPV